MVVKWTFKYWLTFIDVQKDQMTMKMFVKCVYIVQRRSFQKVVEFDDISKHYECSSLFYLMDQKVFT